MRWGNFIRKAICQDQGRPAGLTLNHYSQLKFLQNSMNRMINRARQGVTTTDLMDELELQSEILRQITAKATVVSADYVIGETIKGSEEHDGEIQMKKGKTIKVGSKSMKAKKKIPKSPLLKRSEIKACIDLHNACENADILQEIIHPAICFGSSHEATCSLEQGTTIKEVESKKEVDEPVFVEEVTWQDPPQPRPRKPVFAGKPRWQPIRVAGLALNQFSHFSGCHVNVSQDTSCATAFIHAAIAGVLVYYQSLIPTTYKDIEVTYTVVKPKKNGLN